MLHDTCAHRQFVSLDFNSSLLGQDFAKGWTSIMLLANTPERYGAVTKTFHWLTAIGILTMIPMGFVAVNLPAGSEQEIADKIWLFSLHKTAGVTLFFIALARIIWAVTQAKPVALHPDRRLETFAAEVVHWMLYGALVFVPLSGWLHHAALDGFAPIWWPFGQNLPLVPKSDSVATLFAGMHFLFILVLVASLAAHISGALKHVFIDRDATLARMLPGRTEAGGPRHARSGLAPFSAAAVIWAAVTGVAATAPLSRPGPPALVSVASDWGVQDGTIALTITQNGTAVTGAFDEWTAAISYDPKSGAGQAGEATVTIAMNSLILGAVTDLARGTDYLATTQFPTATYKGPIMRTQDGSLVLDGTLSLRDIDIKSRLPFELTLDGSTARAQGTLRLDRRDFSIGAGVTDAGQLGFDVVIEIDLIAVKG
jgi:cytochrome b561/polyisoprenoid-binding protein YceI